MVQVYHDAMALVRNFGQPSFFITMTANDNWSEVKRELKYGQTAMNRPDIICRVFELKLRSMMEDINDKERLGPGISHVQTIEFQSRGRPHAHFIPIMAAGGAPRTPEDVDMVVRAEIPDRESERDLYDAVTSFMLHGPCNEDSACMVDKKCRFNYPKPFAERTTMTDEAYPEYRRRNNGVSFTNARGYVYTNQHVVPYNPYLLLKYNCHINVEVAVSMQSLKYLYKYITKGHDRAALSLVATNEIDVHINGRSITGTEGVPFVVFPCST